MLWSNIFFIADNLKLSEWQGTKNTITKNLYSNDVPRNTITNTYFYISKGKYTVTYENRVVYPTVEEKMTSLDYSNLTYVKKGIYTFNLLEDTHRWCLSGKTKSLSYFKFFPVRTNEIINLNKGFIFVLEGNITINETTYKKYTKINLSKNINLQANEDSDILHVIE